MNKGAFVDTDIIMKIGNFRGEKLLSKILLSFGYDLYIHEYLKNEELVYGGQALKQVKEMIGANELTIMYETMLNNQERHEYELALNILSAEMGVNLHRIRDKNAGEAKSMAMAFAKDFEYFI